MNKPVKTWSQVKTADKYLSLLKERGYTDRFIKSNAPLFGDVAVKVNKCLRKDGQHGMDMLKQASAIWYMATEALEQLDKLRKESKV